MFASVSHTDYLKIFGHIAAFYGFVRIPFATCKRDFQYGEFMILQTKNLNIYIEKDNRLLIKDFSFSLQNGDKVAIIGEEGNGKSTLLKFLYDENSVSDYTHYSGKVIRKGRFGYLPQFMPQSDLCMPVAEFLSSTDIYSLYDEADCMNLDFDLLTSNRIMGTLSGGEKIKIQLLKILGLSPDVIFLDEPSNDLDIDSLSFLESFISDSALPTVFISHDEILLKRTANTVIHIEQLTRKTNNRITIAHMKYDDYANSRESLFKRKEQIAAKQRSDFRKQKERLQKLYEKARHNNSWKNPDGILSSDGNARKHLQSVISVNKRIEREKDNFEDIPEQETSIMTEFDSAIYIPKQKRIVDLELRKLSVGERDLSENIRLTVMGDKHVCIIGKNGTGKSTLLKTILGKLKERTDINVGYMPQNYEETLDFHITPIEFLQADLDKERMTKAMTYMRAMRFTIKEINSPIGKLSGGQKAKLLFLYMVLKNCDVLILDEPTRNFSPMSAPVIRQALARFKGTIISVSHDRKYIEDVADEIYVLDKNGLHLL